MSIQEHSSTDLRAEIEFNLQATEAEPIRRASYSEFTDQGSGIARTAIETVSPVIIESEEVSLLGRLTLQPYHPRYQRSLRRLTRAAAEPSPENVGSTSKTQAFTCHTPEHLDGVNARIWQLHRFIRLGIGGLDEEALVVIRRYPFNADLHNMFDEKRQSLLNGNPGKDAFDHRSQYFVDDELGVEPDRAWYGVFNPGETLLYPNGIDLDTDEDDQYSFTHTFTTIENGSLRPVHRIGDATLSLAYQKSRVSRISELSVVTTPDNIGSTFREV